MNQILNLMKSNTGRFKSLLVPPSSKSSSNFSMKPFIRTPTIPIGVLVHNTRMGDVVNDEITINSIADCTHYTLSSVDIIDIRISYKG